MSKVLLWLRFLRNHWEPILAGLVVLYFAVVAIGKIHAYGQRQYQAGRNAVIAEDAIAAAQSRLDADQHAAAAAAAGVAMHTTLDIALPRIEVTTHDTVDKIHTIYLAAPAGPAAVCVRPLGVQTALDAARDRANTAARSQL
ncbi:hypothetical protein [Rhodanobacter thiooxydans]|uniref:hypothetical protein n=1 Tax=Rhodanobacter thiooxydans TaxID=416169 RepID=UPI000260DE3D|nr:hypothetical protein [Rhodanobacter thiooxydans]EIL99156.1 hypothetical protein UUA_09121 [Rhodanobacter thiooxydans LCS2]